MKSRSLVSALLAAILPFTAAAPTAAVDLEYEYIVVGSGAGGGPLACRLAMAGHKTLLIEAGDDQVSASLSFQHAPFSNRGFRTAMSTSLFQAIKLW